jgi:hypothetical protein
MWIAFMIMNASTMTHSHVRLRNSSHPVRRSRSSVDSPEPTGGGSFTRASTGIAHSHPATCTSIAHAGPAVATRMPAITGPPMVTADLTNDKSAFACCRFAGVVSCGMMPCIAGSTNAVDAPFTAASTIISGIVAVPLNSSAAMVPMDRMSTT